MKLIYIAHAIGGDVKANLKDMRRIIKKINLNYENVIPFCPYYSDVVSLDDAIPWQRIRGMNNAKYILANMAIDELWLTGTHISAGMKEEMEIAKIERITIVDYINQI